MPVCVSVFWMPQTAPVRLSCAMRREVLPSPLSAECRCSRALPKICSAQLHLTSIRKCFDTWVPCWNIQIFMGIVVEMTGKRELSASPMGRSERDPSSDKPHEGFQCACFRIFWITSRSHSKMQGIRFRSCDLLEIAQWVKSRARIRSQCSLVSAS